MAIKQNTCSANNAHNLGEVLPKWIAVTMFMPVQSSDSGVTTTAKLSLSILRHIPILEMLKCGKKKWTLSTNYANLCVFHEACWFVHSHGPSFCETKLQEGKDFFCLILNSMCQTCRRVRGTELMCSVNVRGISEWLCPPVEGMETHQAAPYSPAGWKT